MIIKTFQMDIPDSAPVEYSNCYPMTKKIRGKVLILNNFKDRHGSEVDVENLENLFRQLQFDVVGLRL